MVQRIAIVAPIALVLTSCTEEHVTQYTYEGTTITRLDSGTVARFYLADCATATNPCSGTFLQTSYHGFDAAMAGYLVFLPNRRVEVLGATGWFEKVGKDSIFFFRKGENPALSQWLDSVRLNAKNVLYISSNLVEEIRVNTEYHSQVNAQYLQ